MTLISDLILGYISPIFFEYPWDWDSGQFGLRLSASPKLPMIDCIRASLHGFFEIEMDHVRFHPRSFSQMFTRQICFRHCYLADWIIQKSSILRTLRFTFRWAMIYTLRFTFWDLSIEQLFRHRGFLQFRLFRGLSWCIGSWPIDFSGWLIYWLFRQCEHPGYWGIFPFLVSVVRPLTFWVCGFEPIYFMSTFELVFSIIPF